MKKFCLLKKLIFMGILAIISLCLCACNNNTDTAATTEASTEVATKAATEATQKEENSVVLNDETLPHKNIDNIDELELDKITKISTFVQDEEVFLDDENILLDFNNVIKKLTPNDDVNPPMDDNGSYYYGFTQILAYNNDDLLYTFSLSGAESNYKVYVDDNKSYFYCDINSDDVEKFNDIHSKICSTVKSTDKSE